MKMYAWNLKKGMKIKFKNIIYEICDVIQCGTTKTSIYVNNDFKKPFRRFLNYKEVEVINYYK